MKDVKTLAVIGAGAMGRGIAYCGMAAGYTVRVTDADPDQAQAALDWIVKRAGRDGVDASRVSAVAGIAADCAGIDLAIEAVVEKLEAKVAVFRAVAEAAPDAILASNTSGIPIGRIGEGVGVPAKVVGMHFFNPVPRMRLCEIVVGKDTSEEAIAVAVAVAEKMGKTPVRTGDTPGFLASRIITNTADCGACSSWLAHDSIQIERGGVPVVMITARAFVDDAGMSMVAYGMPDLPTAIFEGVEFTSTAEAEIIALEFFRLGLNRRFPFG